MVDFYNIGVSIVQKEIDVIYDILANKDKLHKIYIHLPT
jgi:hypothetical protein